MPAPNPLWSGDRDPGLRDPETEPRTEPLPTYATPEPASRAMPATPPPPAEPQEPHRPFSLRNFGLAFLVAAVVVLVAGAAGAKLFSHDGPGTDIAAAKPLPAAKGANTQTQVNAIYRSAGESVVQVRRGDGSGTGFIVQGPGLIVTNEHVVGDADKVTIVLDHSVATIPGTVLGRDKSADLAVVKVDPRELKGRKALPLAESNDVAVGDLAVAIGYPLGLDRTVTAGIVSGIGRQIQAPNGFSIDKVIQTDAPINPGNSGGPLLDSRGRVMGVNSQIATAGSQGNVGIGFAVPSDSVRDVIPTLSTGKQVKRPYLGVSTAPPADGSAGAQIAEVRPGGPASASGLQGPAFLGGTGGDVIVDIDGTKVGSPEDVSSAISGKQPGDKVTLQVKRNGGIQSVTVTLGTRPSNASP